MPIFYEQAIRAAANGDPVDWIHDEHLSEWRGLASALDRLTPEQRCDAIYADWLLQLNSPAALALLQVRNLLIGQGALAANFHLQYSNAKNAKKIRFPYSESSPQRRSAEELSFSLRSLSSLRLNDLFRHENGARTAVSAR